MKRMFKLILLISSSMLLISKSWGFAVAGTHYAYVSGNEGESAFLTRYQIDGNGNFINPMVLHMDIPDYKYKISGIALAPDHRYIYVAYGPRIFRVHLKDNDHSLDSTDMHYYELDNSFAFGDTSLAVSTIYNKLYFVAHCPFNRKVYSFDIDQENNDDLINLKEVSGPLTPNAVHPKFSVNKGISVANDGTIFVNTMMVDGSSGSFLVSALPVDDNGNVIEGFSATFARIDGQYLGNSKYISIINGHSAAHGLLVISEMTGGLATICGINLSHADHIDRIKPCLKVSTHTNFSFARPTFDVEVNPQSPNMLYFTSGNQIFKWEIPHRDQAPVSMHFTRDIPSKYIVTF